MNLESEHGLKIGPKTKIATGVTIAAVVLVLLLEMTLLRGTQIANLTVGLGPEDTGTIVVTDVGKTHLVEIETRRRRAGKNEGRRINMRLEDPAGQAVYESGEWTNKKRRFFSFTPTVPGSYKIFLEPGLLAGSAANTARVKVLVGDKRFLSRMFAAMPF